MSDSDLEGYDWANEMQYLQRSSEHGSDGEIYIPEPTQQDEMKRVYLRRLHRQRKEERRRIAPSNSAIYCSRLRDCNIRVDHSTHRQNLKHTYPASSVQLGRAFMLKVSLHPRHHSMYINTVKYLLVMPRAVNAKYSGAGIET
ncbi:hypothetical protein C8J57DRAFT_1246927 [Mycena rebaudengoi]|nr:hypothetical protein C8J57DRAFT_1246927 [Mycena rebaudengoi]